MVEHPLGKGEVMRSIRITGTRIFFLLRFRERPDFCSGVNYHGKGKIRTHEAPRKLVHYFLLVLLQGDAEVVSLHLRGLQLRRRS